MTEEKVIQDMKKRDFDIQDMLSDFSHFYVLLMLNEKPLHGYGLMKGYQNRTGKKLSPGTLYPFLQELEEKKLVRQKQEDVGKKRKIIYSLTKKGKQFSERLFKRFAAITVSALGSSLEACASCGARVYEGAHHEEVEGVDLAFCCIHCAKAFKQSM
ncbi:MAG: PadR family transcriptional regulator [Candidatus Thorarchaeota archaeon]|jgi:DNA-binding PadR family transcriptional regulator